MSFDAPWALVALVVLPLAAAGYVAVWRRRDARAAAFAAPALLPNIVDRAPGWRRHLPPALLLLAVAAFLVGVARPHATVSHRSEEATAIVAIDASRSMGATDVEPSRLVAAQAIARRFVDALPGSYRAAVVAFGSRAQVVTVPTRDRDTARAAIRSLRPGEATALGDALSTAVRVARSTAAGAPAQSDAARPARSPAAILVLSDGAADGGQIPLPAAIDQARAARVPVYTGLIGTEAGVVEVRHPAGYVERISVPPDPGALRTTSQRTGGRLFTAPDGEDFRQVVDGLTSRLATERRREEVTYAFAAGGAALLLAGCILSTAWFRRIA